MQTFLGICKVIYSRVPSLKDPYPYWSIGIIRLDSEKVAKVISLAEYSICRTWNRRVDEIGGTIECMGYFQRGNFSRNNWPTPTFKGEIHKLSKTC